MSERRDEGSKIESAADEQKEGLRKRYESILKEGVELHTNFNKADWETEGHKMTEELDRALTERVGLIRELEDIKTMNEAFPESSYPPGHIDKVKKLRKLPPRPETHLFNAEDERVFTQFTKTLKQQAQDMGYKIYYENPKLGWIAFQKENLVFDMKYMAIPGKWTIGESTRMTKFKVYVEGEETYMDYQHGWHVACEDIEVQREIDRFIAAFG